MLGNYDRKTFINVTDGKLRQRCEPDHPDAKERKVTNPKTGDSKIVTELVHDFLEGLITKIYVREQEGYSKQWAVEIQDGPEDYAVTFGYESGYAFSFLTRIFNVEITKPVRLIPYYFEEDRRTGIALRQDGEKIVPFYTKDNPHDMPRLENPDDESERKIWKIQVAKFLTEKVAEVITPALNKLYSLEEPVPAEDMKVKTTKEKEKESAIFADPDETGADDLPFA